MPKCPHCTNGVRSIASLFPVLVSPDYTGFDALIEELRKCQTCNATGLINYGKVGWITFGEEAREKRLKEGRGLRKEAERLGVLPSEVCAFEAGQKEHPEYRLRGT